MFEIHLQVRYIQFLSVCADGEKGLGGSRGGRTTRVVKAAPERGDKKARRRW